MCACAIDTTAVFLFDILTLDFHLQESHTCQAVAKQNCEASEGYGMFRLEAPARRKTCDK